MKYFERLKRISKVLVSSEKDDKILSKTLTDYKSLLLEITKVNLEMKENQENIHLSNGMAIGLTWAAKCVEDLVRTRQFIKGTFNAVSKLKNDKKKINILYAGCGPFATLVLPLTTFFKAEDIQFILLEINPKSVTKVKQVFKKLKIDDYLQKVVQTDASKYNIDKKDKIDVIISETMQHSLQNEQQFSILLNLVSQISQGIQIIPQTINLDLALVNSNQTFNKDEFSENRYKKISSIIELNENTIRELISKNELSKVLFEKKIQIPNTESIKQEYDLLAIISNIQIFDQEWILENESGLTIEKILMNTSDLKESSKQINFKYITSPIPRFDFRIIEKTCG